MDDTLKFALTIAAGIFGWLIVHLFTMTRDRANKIRDLRTKYLIEAFQKLEKNSNRKEIDKKEFEAVMADIQLFGTSQEAELAKEFISEFSGNKGASLNPLIHLLRENLRKELRLAPAKSNMAYLRLYSAKNTTGESES